MYIYFFFCVKPTFILINFLNYNYIYLNIIYVIMQFGLLCEDNRWKLSMVGTINNIGQFIGMPISGVIADK